MSWLEGLAEPDWRMYHSDSEVQTIAKETLVLLKEQEAVEPKPFNSNGWLETKTLWKCGACGARISKRKTRFCEVCGRAVKWDG